MKGVEQQQEQNSGGYGATKTSSGPSAAYPRPTWTGCHRALTTPKPLLGNSRACCGTCCIFPKDFLMGLIPMVLLLLPVIVHLTSVVPSGEWYSFVIVSFLTVLALLFQFFATACDPGIIPPRMYNAPPPQPEVVMLSNGTETELKVCPTCNINRPPRSSHCTTCDYCVEEFDHHCGVLGSCVAQRTFRFFTLYFYAITALALYVFVRSIVFLATSDLTHLTKEQGHLGRWRVVAAIGCTLYSFCGGCCVGGQMCFYTALACTNQTRKIEHQRELNKAAMQPGLPGGATPAVYDTEREVGSYSCCAFCSRLCGPMPKSRIV